MPSFLALAVLTEAHQEPLTPGDTYYIQKPALYTEIKKLTWEVEYL